LKRATAKARFREKTGFNVQSTTTTTTANPTASPDGGHLPSPRGVSPSPPAEPRLGSPAEPRGVSRSAAAAATCAAAAAPSPPSEPRGGSPAEPRGVSHSPPAEPRGAPHTARHRWTRSGAQTELGAPPTRTQQSSDGARGPHGPPRRQWTWTRTRAQTEHGAQTGRHLPSPDEAHLPSQDVPQSPGGVQPSQDVAQSPGFTVRGVQPSQNVAQTSSPPSRCRQPGVGTRPTGLHGFWSGQEEGEGGTGLDHFGPAYKIVDGVWGGGQGGDFRGIPVDIPPIIRELRTNGEGLGARCPAFPPAPAAVKLTTAGEPEDGAMREIWTHACRTLRAASKGASNGPSPRDAALSVMDVWKAYGNVPLEVGGKVLGKKTVKPQRDGHAADRLEHRGQPQARLFGDETEGFGDEVLLSRAKYIRIRMQKRP